MSSANAQIASEVLRSMNEAVTVLDRNFHFISVNPAFTRMTGYGDDEVVGRGAELLDSTQHDPAFYRHIRDIVDAPGPLVRRDVAAAQGRRGIPLRDRGQRRARRRAASAALLRRRAQRHHRPEARRAGTALPRQLRHADQPAQPHPAVRTAVARDRARAPREQPRRGAVPRPRPLQGHQRFARPRRRRPHPALGRGAPAADRGPAPHRRAAGRRRIHGGARRPRAAGAKPTRSRARSSWPSRRR